MNTRGYSRQDQQGLLGALRTFQYRRRRPISLLSAFMLMAAVLAPITLIASPANAATVNRLFRVPVGVSGAPVVA